METQPETGTPGEKRQVPGATQAALARGWTVPRKMP